MENTSATLLHPDARRLFAPAAAATHAATFATRRRAEAVWMMSTAADTTIRPEARGPICSSEGSSHNHPHTLHSFTAKLKGIRPMAARDEHQNCPMRQWASGGPSIFKSALFATVGAGGRPSRIPSMPTVGWVAGSRAHYPI